MIATCADLCLRSYDAADESFVDVGDFRYGVFGTEHGIIICIRGTANAQNWLTDVRAWPTRTCGGYLAHKGFVRAYQALCAGGMPTVRGDNIIATGHSLGGAIATLLGEHTGARVISFGSPKVYARFFPAPQLDHIRVARDDDPVPHLPGICYSHRTPPMVMDDGDGCPILQVSDHPMKGYCAALKGA